MIQYQTRSRIGGGISPYSHREGKVARTIEEQTAKLPSDTFLWAAGACMAGSLILQLSGRKHEALFIGMWAPSLLIMGLYNKLVKVAGHEGEHIGAPAAGASGERYESFGH